MYGRSGRSAAVGQLEVTGAVAAAARRSLSGLSRTSIALGRARYQEGGVLHTLLDGEDLLATVKGSRGERPFHVRGRLGTSLSCTCGWEENCKHVGAALAAILLAPMPGLALSSAAATRPPSPPPWRDWLGRLDAPPPLSPGERVVLVLEVDALRLLLAAQRRLVRGGWGRPVPLGRDRVAELLSGRRSDPEAAEVVAAIPWTADGSLALRERAGARALATAIDSERLYVVHTRALDPSVAALAVTRGEAVEGKLAWRIDDLVQRPMVEVALPSVELLPLAPVHYLDRESGRLGVVEVPGLDPTTPARWLTGPAVTLDQVPDVERALRSRAAALPAPVALTLETVELPPVARLRLVEAPGLDRAETSLRIAELSFRYGDFIVGGYGPAELTLSPSPTRRVLVRRDVAAEGALRARLAELGFIKALVPGVGTQATAEAERWMLPTSQAWLMFLYDDALRLGQEGFEVVVDASFSLYVVEGDDWYTDLESSGTEWFSLELGIVVEGRRVSLLPALLAALQDEADLERPIFLAHPEGGHVVVPRERIEPLATLLLELAAEPPGKPPRLSTLAAMDLAAVVRAEHGAMAAMRALRSQLTDGASGPPLRLPKAFRASLRPYQLQGVEWLAKLRRAGLGAVLADDMGLGKTVQIIALLCLLRQAKKGRRPSLVVAPTSVLLSWVDQLQAFAPHLDVVLWHGPQRAEAQARLATADVVLTSYALLHRDAEELVQRPWDLCVLDEAQMVKNAKTVFSARAREIDARMRIAITGTPMENHLGELWSIMSFAVPGALGSERAFRGVYRNPIERDRNPAALEGLRRRLAPILLRRTKEQVASELPPKTVIEHVVELDGAQRDVYEAVRQMMVKAVRDEIEKKGFARAKIMVLDALLKLRQICCDPRLLKAKTAKRAARSAKLEAFAELVPTLVEDGRRILVFSQFVEMLGLLGETLDAMRIPFLTLTGSTVDRRGVVDMFRRGTIPVFLISLKAGGTGLNLVEADTVIHYDPWWNPAVENQATDRAHRIGQTRPVFVHKLIAHSTVEQKIAELQKTKAQLARGLLDGSFELPLLDQKTVDALLSPMG
jgi:superfamily II DNA or RNA helicase